MTQKRIAIIGGKLQGLEATYLAKKAGWKVILIDKKIDVPSSRLSDEFFIGDIKDIEWLNSILKDVDFVIPATENLKTLDILSEWSRNSLIPFVFDADAYRISSSKLKSDSLFFNIGVPAPLPWPNCDFPIIGKPSEGSGSEGVHIFHSREQMESHFSDLLLSKEWVLQEYIGGPSFSLELIGTPGNYIPLQVTDLEMDSQYDCKRVSAPTVLSDDLVERFKEISIQIAEAINLKGVMDVEVILHRGELKVLEIDARLPSQTPTVVYHSSGSNIIELLSLSKEFKNTIFPVNKNKYKGVIYEHIKVGAGKLKICGERIIGEAGVLSMIKKFFGADEALTNYKPGQTDWVATMIYIADDLQKARYKREQVIRNIMKSANLDEYEDSGEHKI